MGRKFPRESERRLVTIIFADISGFTAMSEKMDAEAMSLIMNDCFSMMENIIEKHNGAIDKFIGDCVMALFGLPSAIDKPAIMAVKSAFRMREALYEFNMKRNLSIPLDIHIGINTGYVVAGEIGGRNRRDYTVMGDTVNVASRLEDFSRPGQILVGEDTFQGAKHEFDFKSLKPIALKGKAKPIHVYELAELNYPPSKKCAGLRIHSKMIGRDGELALLKTHMDNLLKGRGMVVNIIGEAGIGKSRLVSELKKTISILGVRLMEGRAISMGGNLSFHPFTFLFKNMSMIRDDDSEEEAFDKLFTILKGLLHDEAVEALPFIGLLTGIKVPEQYKLQVESIRADSLEHLMLKNLKSFFMKISRKSPIVVIIEDLHWADQSSLMVLPALCGLTKSNPILFINLMRPCSDESWQKARENLNDICADRYEELLIRPLSSHLAKALVSSLLITRPLPKDLPVRQIIKRSEGNPFFLEEVVRSITETSTAQPKTANGSPVNPIAVPTIPQSISDVIMERIDRLDENSRRLLMVASVIGRNFFLRIITRVYENQEVLEPGLKILQDGEFIIKKKKNEEIEYFFTHGLIQETAYKSLLENTKKDLHRKIAIAIEELFQNRLPEFYGMLAYHFSSSEDHENAEDYLVKAGREALRSGASSEAVTYYKQALEIFLIKHGDYADPFKTAVLEKNIAQSLYNKGNHLEALGYYKKALKNLGAREPGKGAGFLLGFVFCFLDFLIAIHLPFLKWKKKPSRDTNLIIEINYHKLSILASLDPKRFFMESFYFSRQVSKYRLDKIKDGVGMFVGLSIVFAWPATSFHLSNKILNFLKDKIVQGDLKSSLYFQLAKLFPDYYTGKWDSVYSDEMVDHSLKIGEILHAGIYLMFHGRMELEKGNYTKAKKLVARLAMIGTEYTHDFAIALKYYLNTKLLLKYRKLQAAMIEADEGIAFLKKTDFKQNLMVQYAFKARIQIMLGDLEAAATSLKKSDLLSLEIKAVPPYTANCLLAKLSLYISLIQKIADDPAGKEKNKSMLRKQAMTVLTELTGISKKMICEHMEIFKKAGSLFALLGQEHKALKHWDRSINQGIKTGARLELARTYMDLGLYLNRPGKLKLYRNKPGGHYLDMASSMFSEMNLQWDIAELKKSLET